ncbi:MAG: 4'-phosphopantetheinyl transferase superfamily protein, partial [Clostridia bacterium]|nr:4'-phosphopantetheinyl transferase superfamily protein [Clostridia bacterium]
LMRSPYTSNTDAEILWDGKPRFADPGLGLSFNLSHVGAGRSGENSAGYAAVVLSDEGPCGVDIELPRGIRNREALTRKLFCDAELEYLAQREPEAFFDIWCAKEAFVKYTGEGFSRPLSTVLTDPTTGTAMSSDGAVRCALKVFRERGLTLCAAAEVIPASLAAEYVCAEDVLRACQAGHAENSLCSAE